MNDSTDRDELKIAREALNSLEVLAEFLASDQDKDNEPTLEQVSAIQKGMDSGRLAVLTYVLYDVAASLRVLSGREKD